MSNRDSYRDRFINMLQNDEIAKFCRELVINIRLGANTKVGRMLDILEEEHCEKYLQMYEEDGATVLHEATIFQENPYIISRIGRMCPNLLTFDRPSSSYFKGQTALHIAITKKNLDVVETLLNLFQNSISKITTLHSIATGSRFTNTVMMGELPLTVASLTCEPEMVALLIKHDAEIDRRNSRGDTVLHSLVEFAAIYPDQLTQIIEMLRYLVGELEQKSNHEDKPNAGALHQKNYTWFLKNNMNASPLQLAAKHGMVDLCQYIFQIPGVYQILDDHDGLFDIKNYDITEIDPIAMMKLSKNHVRTKRCKVKPADFEGVATRSYGLTTSRTNIAPGTSLSEMIFEIDATKAFSLIDLSPIKRVIKTKWEYYILYYIVWAVLHTLFMTGFTIYAILKTDENTQAPPDQKGTIVQHNEFLKAYSYISVFVSIVYILQEITRLIRKRSLSKAVFWKHMVNEVIYSNGFYRGSLFLFGLFLLIDSGFNVSGANDDNIPLIFALVLGWWYELFFLRGWLKFSFFTVMIHKVIVGDLFRFSVIIVIALVSYSGSMYVVFKGSNVTVVDSFQGTMMILFKLLLGLGDIEVLNEAKHPWLATTLFVFFVVLTYVLLFNALIAMMSSTCNCVSENRYVQWRVQQLAVIMFFEGIFPFFLVKHVGEVKVVRRFDPVEKRMIEEQRTFLQVISLQTEYADTETIKSLQNLKQAQAQALMRTFVPAPDEGEEVYSTLSRLSRKQSRKLTRHQSEKVRFMRSRNMHKSRNSDHPTMNGVYSVIDRSSSPRDPIIKCDACVEISNYQSKV